MAEFIHNYGYLVLCGLLLLGIYLDSRGGKKCEVCFGAGDTPYGKCPVCLGRGKH